MSRPFDKMHPFVKVFANEALRHALVHMGEGGEFDAQDFEDMRSLLISGAKATIDLEVERKQRGVKSGIVLAGPGLVPL